MEGEAREVWRKRMKVRGTGPGLPGKNVYGILL